MPRKREERLSEWVNSAEAASILTANSGHTVGTPYVRELAAKGRIETKQMSGRDKLYRRADCEKLIIQKRGK